MQLKFDGSMLLMITSILQDVRTIVSDDAALQTGILPALESYNVAQFITVDVPGQSHQVQVAI